MVIQYIYIIYQYMYIFFLQIAYISLLSNTEVFDTNVIKILKSTLPLFTSTHFSLWYCDYVGIHLFRNFG